MDRGVILRSAATKEPRSKLAFAALLALAPILVGACKDDPKGGPFGTGPAASASAAPAPSVPMNATPLPSASVAAMLGADRLPPYQGPTGSIEGTISVVGDPAPDATNNVNFSKCPEAAKTYGKLFREGAPVTGGAPGARALADALVGVTGYTGFYVPERKEARQITIENCALNPRTVDITFGQRLEIANKTHILFAPELVGVFTPALMAAPPGGDAVKIYPQRPGYFPLRDKLGNDFLRGDVYVLLYPLHTVSSLDGHYRIDGLPLGKVNVFARLNTIGEAAKSIEILAGVVSKVDLTLTYAPKGADAGAKSDAGVAQAPIK